MFATVRETTFDPDKLRQGRAQLEAFWALRDRQPGSGGDVAVDAGGAAAAAGARLPLGVGGARHRRRPWPSR